MPLKSNESQTLNKRSEDLPHGNGELVLVVDDEESLIEVTRVVMESNGYRVLTAGDGVEAITTYADLKDEISLVLTDLVMPFMDGPSTIRAICRLNPAARVIAWSGAGDRTLIRDAILAGARRFIPKPFTVENLLRSMHEMLK
jgi:two-component system cell cycle sensor histidine kinase/response regulator CckA